MYIPVYSTFILDLTLKGRSIDWSVLTYVGIRNKHIQVDFGTGNNNKVNFPIATKQELIDIIEVAYKAASKGKGLAVSPKDYSTKWMY
jgi:hypothetical protein